MDAIINAVNCLGFFLGGFSFGFWFRSQFAKPEPEQTPPPVLVYGKPIREFNNRAWTGSTGAKTARGTRSDLGSIPSRSTVQDAPPNVPEAHTRPDRYTLNSLLLLIRNEYGNGARIPREGVKLSYRDLTRYKISRKRADVLRAWVIERCGYEDINGVVWLARSKARDFQKRMVER